MRTENLRLDTAFWASLILANVQEGYAAYTSAVFAVIIGVAIVLSVFTTKEN